MGFLVEDDILENLLNESTRRRGQLLLEVARAGLVRHELHDLALLEQTLQRRVRRLLARSDVVRGVDVLEQADDLLALFCLHRWRGVPRRARPARRRGVGAVIARLRPEAGAATLLRLLY